MNEMKLLRERLKVSQFRLSQLAGVQRFRISRAECGYLTLSSDEALRIEFALREEFQRLKKLNISKFLGKGN